ncbi:MAG: hypothetical protein EOP56_08945 [Sphingobacteriales bacterium]|nr:MAG: hypothetical protein EOP56_08945 [Sphingobacteriales bacterium]
MSIPAKLKLKDDAPLWLINAPDQVAKLFTAFDSKTTLPKKQAVAQVILFAADKAGLEQHFTGIEGKLLPDALLWLAYPKKSGKIKSDMTRDAGWDVVFAAGYEPVMQIAIDEDWSALRFRPSGDIKDRYGTYLWSSGRQRG